jgi:hypothetical protein
MKKMFFSIQNSKHSQQYDNPDALDVTTMTMTMIATKIKTATTVITIIMTVATAVGL